MEIIASSVRAVGGFFLHAGYMSAYAPVQHSLKAETVKEIFTTAEPSLQLNLTEALRLKGEVIGSGAQGIGHPILNHMPGLMRGDQLAVILGVLIFIGGLALIYRTQRHEPSRKWAMPLSSLALILICIAAFAGGFDSLTQRLIPPKPPWDGVAPQAYEHPEAATKAILYGMLADPVMKSRQYITSLAEIKNEVGLPGRDLTAGQRYALATYGLDGWGRQFRLEWIPGQDVMSNDNKDTVTVNEQQFFEYRAKGYDFINTIWEHYSIISNGPDGLPDTADDIQVNIRPFMGRRFDGDENEPHWGYFVQHLGEDRLLFIHRGGLEYRAAHGWRASQLTGGLLYDVLDFPRGVPNVSDPAPAAPAPGQPLWLVVFKHPDGQMRKLKS